MDNIRLNKDINTGAICNFINECHKNGTNIRAFICVKDNKTLASVAIKPYSFSDRMLVYSLSKSFTSVCIGIAQEEGLLNIEERIIDIFTDKLPDTISENLQNMRIKDCLCMTSGHSSCCMEKITYLPDSVAAFLSQPVEYQPGSRFVYSTAATYICGAALERRSGMSLVDYLYEKVLKKMGMEKPFWRRCADGSCKGGTGLHMSADDIAKFGIMLRDGGVYEKQRIVPAEWVKTASEKHSSAQDNGTPDWTAGYGYQFWLNEREGYRGDGAYGQLCMVFPQRNMVFAMLCESSGMQKEVDLTYELLEEVEKADYSRLDELKSLTQSLYAPEKTIPLVTERRFLTEKNIAGINTITLKPDGDGMEIVLDCDYGNQIIKCGNGAYIKNTPLLMNLSPALYNNYIFGHPEQVSFFASYNNNSSDEIVITLRHIDSPHVQVWRFPKAGKGDWSISMRTGTLNEKIIRTPLCGC